MKYLFLLITLMFFNLSASAITLSIDSDNCKILYELLDEAEHKDPENKFNLSKVGVGFSLTKPIIIGPGSYECRFSSLNARVSQQEGIVSYLIDLSSETGDYIWDNLKFDSESNSNNTLSKSIYRERKILFNLIKASSKTESPYRLQIWDYKNEYI